MAETLKPAEVWPVGTFIQEEMDARGWDMATVAYRMGATTLRDASLNLCCVAMLLAVHDKNLVLDRDTAEGLGRAFDVSPDYFLNLDRMWREHGPHPANDRTALNREEADRHG